MTRNAALTVRLPGARIAPAKSTWTYGHTRLENSGMNGFSRCSILAGRVRIITSLWRTGDDRTLPFLPHSMDKVEQRNCLINSWRASRPWCTAGARGQNGASLPPYTRSRDPKIGPTAIYQTVSEGESRTPIYSPANRYALRPGLRVIVRPKRRGEQHNM